jgi:hypothetical protein
VKDDLASLSIVCRLGIKLEQNNGFIYYDQPKGGNKFVASRMEACYMCVCVCVCVCV